ncbi:MAG: YwaF family protein [Sphaerochaetaceae bacterium]|nr:YwaF family protein [Sphaerochaetaceae bacterium]
MAITIAAIVGITHVYKDKTRAQKLVFLRWFSVISFALWILYKYGLYADPTFDFIFWKELPFQPCNTMMWLAIVAAFFDVTIIMDYGFYVGIASALMALVMPETGFYNIPFFSIRALGFYGTHALVLMVGVLFVTMGLTKVSYKNALRSIIFFMAMACVMHLVNTVFRHTVYSEASYYFTYGNEDNFLLSAFKRFIPVNLLYMLPIFMIAYGVFLLETYLILLPSKLGRKGK